MIGVWVAASRILHLVLRVENQARNSVYEVDDIQRNRDCSSPVPGKGLVQAGNELWVGLSPSGEPGLLT